MGMKIVGSFDIVKNDTKDVESMQFMADVLKGLKAKPRQGLKLDLDVKSREEAVKKVKYLMKAANGMKAEYRRILLAVKLLDNNGFEVEAVLKVRKHKKAAKKAKSWAAKGAEMPAIPGADAMKAVAMSNFKDVKEMLENPDKNPAQYQMFEQMLKAQGMTKEQYLTMINEAIKQQGAGVRNGKNNRGERQRI